jgi:hypothetical protein
MGLVDVWGERSGLSGASRSAACRRGEARVVTSRDEISLSNHSVGAGKCSQSRSLCRAGVAVEAGGTCPFPTVAPGESDLFQQGGEEVGDPTRDHGEGLDCSSTSENDRCESSS